MKIRHAIGTGMIWLPLLGAAGFASLAAGGQSLLSPGAVNEGPVPSSESSDSQIPAVPQGPNNLSSNSSASALCAQGTRAIDQGRWADAVKIFTQVADQRGDHADAALYWKAYAENKLGKTDATLKSCTALRAGFPKSRWIDDCGALEVELRAKSGEPAHIDPSQSDDVKLLALNTMLHQNEALALAEIQEILNGDSSDKLKKEVQFILGTHYSNSTYAQIVRISYVEGDVRIQRGAPTGRSASAVWEKAAVDVPLETGFSIATGQGRAEIEFENASTIYLGENSVLTFNDLHETAGIPFTELGLLSGTVSLHFKPYLAGEKLILHMPTNDLVSHFPDRIYARVQAFTDGVAITPLEGGDVRLPGVSKEDTKAGETWVYQPGHAQATRDAQSSAEFAAWDAWVNRRIADRAAQVDSVLDASGLQAPIPGMAEMAGQGKFFDCAPYGTCWEPNAEAAVDEETATVRRNAVPGRLHLELAAYQSSGKPRQSPQSSPGNSYPYPDLELMFPCVPYALQWRMAQNPAIADASLNGAPYLPLRYAWAVCHAGSWVRHKKHYVWVAGGKRRHIAPVRWVKTGHKVGFVPLHPYDVKDRPALNARHVVFVVANRDPVILEPKKLDEAHPVDYLKAPPHEYAKVPLRPLAVIEAPRMEARSFVRTGSTQEVKATQSIPLRFDPKALSFVVARQVTVGGSTKTVLAPFTNRTGTLQAYSGSFAGGSQFRGGAPGSGASGASGSRGGSIGGSGGGSRGGGATSGGASGGGSHGGSSSGAVSSGGGSSGGSSSSASSSGGGSHH